MHYLFAQSLADQPPKVLVFVPDKGLCTCSFLLLLLPHFFPCKDVLRPSLLLDCMDRVRDRLVERIKDIDIGELSSRFNQKCCACTMWCFPPTSLVHFASAGNEKKPLGGSASPTLAKLREFFLPLRSVAVAHADADLHCESCAITRPRGWHLVGLILLVSLSSTFTCLKMLMISSMVQAEVAGRTTSSTVCVCVL